MAVLCDCCTVPDICFLLWSQGLCVGGGGADDHSGATQAPQRTLAFRLVRQVITEMGGRRPKQREVRWEGNQEPEQQFPHRKAGGPGPCSWRGEPGPHPLLSSPPPPGRPQSRRGKHWGENRGSRAYGPVLPRPAFVNWASLLIFSQSPFSQLKNEDSNFRQENL